jgi:hypothetical protein
MFNGFTKEVFSIGPWSCTGVTTNVVGKAEGTILVNAVEVFNTASVATHGSQYITLSLINLGTNGAGTTVIATASTSQTGGSAIPALKPWPLTVTAAAAEVTDGQCLGFYRNEAHSDAADIAGCQVIVRYTQITAAD